MIPARIVSLCAWSTAGGDFASGGTSPPRQNKRPSRNRGGARVSAGMLAGPRSIGVCRRHAQPTAPICLPGAPNSLGRQNGRPCLDVSPARGMPSATTSELHGLGFLSHGNVYRLSDLECTRNQTGLLSPTISVIGHKAMESREPTKADHTLQWSPSGHSGPS